MSPSATHRGFAFFVRLRFSSRVIHGTRTVVGLLLRSVVTVHGPDAGDVVAADGVTVDRKIREAQRAEGQLRLPQR